MPKKSVASETMPPQVLVHLRAFAENLLLARKRRRETRKVWAQRIGVTEPTVIRMEAGDPSVSIGTYATALWMTGLSHQLARLCEPVSDIGALEAEIQVARLRSVRKPVSVAGRLSAANAKENSASEQAAVLGGPSGKTG